MKTNRINRGLLVTAIVALVGFSSISLAGAYGPMRGGNGPSQDCPRYRDGRGPGAANLTDEQIAQVEKLRSEFNQATADLRADLRQKELSLQAELAKKNPDSSVAAALQKEISTLSADLDAKRLVHQLEVKKAVPEAGAGFGGMGPRHGKGGRGPCSN